MGSPLLEVNQKPAVHLWVLGPVPDEFIGALENGLEEEGIPCERRENAPGDMVLAASRAARSSRINVGLAIGAGPDGMLTAVLHHRDLAQAHPLFKLSTRELGLTALYRLGQNAARLVKGNPFIMDTAPGIKQTQA